MKETIKTIADRMVYLHHEQILEQLKTPQP